ncbi:DNA-binding GntR family transcriptional regulator [Palleronia aestuarii]|uniref:DNA-binding GntR family transcriptional regulator n=2 Tax=Palleronia aestuarii TaxID=568105 RepID=A0A2W7NB15_9RHOB|nr:DNA-binding GntR family transcriptional regulator [Palleronia aestuarii]
MNGPIETAKFAPLDREGLVDRIAETLMEAIIAGRIAPGDRLSESTIARDMGVSRAPVREAARLLENSGLVRYRANRGFFVHEIAAEGFRDLYELRIAIETAAALRLIAGDAAAALPALTAALDRLKAAAEGECDVTAMISADLAFHRAICLASGNARFVQVFDQIANETRLGVMLIGRLYDDPAEIARSHEPVLAAIAASDREAVVAAIEYHLGTARDLVPPMLVADTEKRR